MSRGTYGAARPLGVWFGVTAGSGTALLLARGPVEALAAPGRRDASFADLLVALSAVALALAVVRLWVITSLTVAEVLRGPVTARTVSTTRRLVLLACGAALASGASAPASATEGDAHLLAGLRLPDRAVSSPEPRAEAPSARPAVRRPVGSVHLVTPGDTLWSIAAATSPAGTDLDARWRAIWAANRDVVGDDPHLILPGQRLEVPPAGPVDETTHHQHTDETGDRP